MASVDENATLSSLNVQAELVAKLEKPLVIQRGTAQPAETLVAAKPEATPCAKYTQQLSVAYVKAADACTKTWTIAKSSAMKGVSHSAKSRAKFAAWWRAKAPLRKVHRALKSGHEKLRASLNQQQFEQMLLAVKARKERVRAGLNRQKFQELLASQPRFTMGSAKQQVKHLLRAWRQKLPKRLKPAHAEAQESNVVAHPVEMLTAQPVEEIERLPEDGEDVQQRPPMATVAVSLGVFALPAEPAEGLPVAEEILQMADFSELAVNEEPVVVQIEAQEEAAPGIAGEEDPMEVAVDIAELPVGASSDVQGEVDTANHGMMPQDMHAIADPYQADVSIASAQDAYDWNQYTDETSS